MTPRSSQCQGATEWDIARIPSGIRWQTDLGRKKDRRVWGGGLFSARWGGAVGGCQARRARRPLPMYGGLHNCPVTKL